MADNNKEQQTAQPSNSGKSLKNTVIDSVKKKKSNKTLLGTPVDQIELNPILNKPNLNNSVEHSGNVLRETSDSTAVMAFGRYNPPTIGHEKLINKVKDVAAKAHGSAHIIASHSENSAKNPLPVNKKVEYLKKVAGKDVNVSSSSRETPSVLHAAVKLHNAGHKHLIMVAGSDRVPEYHEMLHKYNGVNSKHGYYNFKSIKVVSAGNRDPDAEGASGMSGTKLRNVARSGGDIRPGLPKALHPHADEIANHIKSVKEDINSDFDDLINEISDKAILLPDNKLSIKSDITPVKSKINKDGKVNKLYGEDLNLTINAAIEAFNTIAEEIDELKEEEIAALRKKASKSGISYDTLKKVYNRGLTAWRSGHRPNTTPQQWAFARVNSYITKGKKTYHGADKDLHEEELLELAADDAVKYVDELLPKVGGKSASKAAKDAIADVVQGAKDLLKPLEKPSPVKPAPARPPKPDNDPLPVTPKEPAPVIPFKPKHEPEVPVKPAPEAPPGAPEVIPPKPVKPTPVEPAPKPGDLPAPVEIPAPKPVPKPEPKPKPSPKPGPKPFPKPGPKPGEEPNPSPSPKPGPSPSPEPGPQPKELEKPQPGPEPAPSPKPEPAPEPAPAPRARPTPEPAPRLNAPTRLPLAVPPVAPSMPVVPPVASQGREMRPILFGVPGERDSRQHTQKWSNAMNRMIQPNEAGYAKAGRQEEVDINNKFAELFNEAENDENQSPIDREAVSRSGQDPKKKQLVPREGDRKDCDRPYRQQSIQKKIIDEAKKSSWDKIVKAMKSKGIDMEASDRRAQEAIKGLKQAASDYQAILDKENKNEKKPS